MRPLLNKRIHSDICFSVGVGKTNFCRAIWIIQRRLTQHIGKQVSPVGKVNIGQSSMNRKNKDFRTNRLVPQILIFESPPILAFCRCNYWAVVSSCG